MQWIVNLQSGKKTYAAGIVMVLIGAGGMLGFIDTQGTLDSAPVLTNPLELFLEGLGIIALRLGIAKQ